MAWEIIVFESRRSEEIVEKFIKKLNPLTIAKIAKEVDLLEKYGLNLGMPHCRRLEKDFYELRIRGKEEIRILYVFRGRKIYLLHIFKKKTQKTPRKEINVALKRLTDI
jgi:phage-related protein